MSSALLEWQLKQFHMDPYKKASKLQKKQSRTVFSQIEKEKIDEVERFRNNLKAIGSAPSGKMVSAQSEVLSLLKKV